MNLVVDAGNSKIKLACFEGPELIWKHEFLALHDALGKIADSNFTNALLASVGSNTYTLENELKKIGLYTLLTHETPLPIEIKYETPNTLGVDRIAGSVGSRIKYDRKNVLVIDAGTCITYDFVDQNNVYQGGGIAPGIDMKFNALNNFTSNLPLVNRKANIPLIGRTTEDSILSGVVQGTLAEIEQIIRMYTSKFADLQVVMCGGDAEYIISNSKTDLELVPELVLEGLNEILQYNVNG